MAEHHPTHEHHGHHPHHAHAHAPRAGATLGIAALLTVAYAMVEGAGGWWTGSLALLSDAGHMLTDGAALGLGALAAWMARRPPSQRHSYGLGRAEVVAALINAAAMLLIIVALAYEAIVRLREPAPVAGGAAALIAAAGLALNLWVMRRLAPHQHDMNTRAARLHVIGDVLGSIAALAAGALIAATGWTRIDPLASLVICGLIAMSSVRLLSVAMTTVPVPGVNVPPRLMSPARSVYDDSASVPAVTSTPPVGRVSARSASVSDPAPFIAKV